MEDIADLEGKLQPTFKEFQSYSSWKRDEHSTRQKHLDTLCQIVTCFIMSHYWNYDSMYGVSCKLERNEQTLLVLKIGVLIREHFKNQDARILSQKIVDLMKKARVLT